MTTHHISRSATACLVLAMALLLPIAAVAEDETSSSSSVSVGTDPSQAKYAGATSADGVPPLTIRTSTQNWEFGFHGYLRAPLRMSFDTQKMNTYPTDADGVPLLDETPKTSDDWRFNMVPVTPDTVYTDWKYTNSLGGPWAEMALSYGNSIAVGTVSVASYNITDSGWRNLQSQLGIDQAFVTMNIPRAFKSRGGLTWNVGVFANRYGSAGRWDAGRYDTYIVGRTHIAGETLTAKLDLTDKLVLVLEHGFGAKTETLGGDTKGFFTNLGADANDFNWVPYGGQYGQWPAMVHHAHAGLVFHDFKWWKELQINAHFMHAFTNKADESNDSPSWPFKEKDGKQVIAGAEVKFNGALFGDLYLGFSRIATDGLDKMPDAIEALHSQGGWCFLKNFYGDQGLIDPINPNGSALSRNSKPNPGTGVITTLAWQYQLSLARLLWGLQDKDFWGQGPDFTLSSWGMVNFVNPDDELEPYLKRWAKRKVKFGFEGMYTPLKYLGFGLRMDRVIPDTEYDVTDVATNQPGGTASSYAPFTIISPKIQFRTSFVTHEEVNIQYSRYFWEKTGLTEDQYRNEVRGENPNEGAPADRNALMISVNMWW